MSELQTRFIVDTYLDYFKSGKHDLAQIYLKSEADELIEEKNKEIAKWKDCRDECERQFQAKVEEVSDLLDRVAEKDAEIAKLRKELSHANYKRCLAMAEMCNAKYDEEDAKVNGCGASWEYISKEMKYWDRWRWRWEALAEKFKEVK